MQAVSLKWPSSTSKYNLVIKKVSKFHSEKVLEKVVSKNSYIWKTDLTGFFSYEVTPVGSKKKISKSIFIDGKLSSAVPSKDIYLCDKEVRFSWRKEQGDLRYLFRLYDHSANKVAHQQVLIGNIYKVNTLSLRPGRKYSRLVIAYDKWGNVSVNSSKVISALRCEDMVKQSSEVPRLVGAYADVSYKLKNNVTSQQGATNELKSNEKQSLLSPAVNLHLHPFRSRFAYSAMASYTSYEDVEYSGASGAGLNDIELGGKISFFIPDLQFEISGGVTLLDKGVYSSKTYDQTQTVIIDRHNLALLMIGAKGSRLLFDRVLDLSIDLGMVAVGTYKKGDGAIDPGTRYSGLRMLGGVDYWISPKIGAKLDFSYLSLSGPDTYTEYGVGLGAIVRFGL